MVKRSSLVSVIIPCYNHAQYLSEALESVMKQQVETEIIVVDDGSQDNPSSVTERYPSVRYIYQSNAGLSAARNTGIRHSTGDKLVFLDADDWLLPEALISNIRSLDAHPHAAFTSGAYELIKKSEHIDCIIRPYIHYHAYYQMLRGNCIGMHATVMYRRWVFDNFEFDTSLPYCEDYDLYLKVTRRFQTVFHRRVIAVYRIHGHNMSHNISNMLHYALLVLQRQHEQLDNETEFKHYEAGRYEWIKFYTDRIYANFNEPGYIRSFDDSHPDIKTLKMHTPHLYEELKKKFRSEKLKSMVPEKAKKVLKKLLRKPDPSSLPITFGSLNRTYPFSVKFGYDRGGPIDRYYIESFLERNRALIKDRVLEIGDNEYTLAYGGNNVAIADVLHISADNPKATFVGDLSNAPQVPDGTFDCIVLTQTLHLIYNCKEALETCYRILKPGGTLLLTVPGISHIAQDEWGKYWQWSFTALSLRTMLEEHFTSEGIEIETFGNTLVAAAFLYGLGLPEIGKKELEYRDPHYQVIITARVTK